jgi:integrase
MASVAWEADRGVWRAKFRGLHNLRSVRVRLDRRFAEDNKSEALSELDRLIGLVRALEDRVTQGRIIEAREAKVINAKEADLLMAQLGLAAMPVAEVLDGRVSIKEAYLSHQSTQQEGKRDIDTAARYGRELDRFLTWSGMQWLDEITYAKMLEYVEYLHANGDAYGTRHHRLMPVRRACMQAPDYGLPDVIGRRLLNKRTRNEQQIKIEFWPLDTWQRILKLEAITVDEVKRSIVYQQLGDRREAVRDATGARLWNKQIIKREQPASHAFKLACVLGAFMGLRQSEIYRAKIEDLDPQAMTLRIGYNERKTAASLRVLPVPPALLPYWQACAGNRPKDQPIIPHLSRNFNKKGQAPDTSHHYHDKTFSRWLRPLLRGAAAGPVPENVARKSFGNMAAAAGMATRDIEAFLGHQMSEAADVSHRHYLVLAEAERLRPAAELIQTWLVH